MSKIFINILEFFAVLSVMFLIVSFLSHVFMRKFALHEWILTIQKKNRFLGNIFAAIFGAITPFCVCTTIPIFTGLIQLGVSTNVAMSFLFASPLINVSSILLMFFLFGLKFALYFLIATLVFSILGGALVYYLKLDNKINLKISSPENSHGSLCKNAASSSMNLFKSLLLPLLFGAIIAGVIHNYVPVKFVEALNKFPVLLIIPLLALIGFPLYLNILVLTPICYSLVNKGMCPAAVMTFMMSGAGISLPTTIVLSRIFKKELFVYYLSYTFIAYCLTGFIFNLLG